MIILDNNIYLAFLHSDILSQVFAKHILKDHSKNNVYVSWYIYIYISNIYYLSGSSLYIFNDLVYNQFWAEKLSD